MQNRRKRIKSGYFENHLIVLFLLVPALNDVMLEGFELLLSSACSDFFRVMPVFIFEPADVDRLPAALFILKMGNSRKFINIRAKC